MIFMGSFNIYTFCETFRLSKKITCTHIQVSCCHIQRHKSLKVFCYLFYTYMFMMNKISKHLGVRKLSWRSPQLIVGLKGQLHLICTHSCVLLHSKTSFGSQAQGICGAIILALMKLNTCSKIANTRKPNCPIGCFLTKSCANAIEAFHRTLGGRMFRHEKMGNEDNVP